MAFLERDQQPSKRAAVETHLEECPPCRRLVSAVVRNREAPVTPAAPGVDEADDLVGHDVEHFHVLRRLGRGGMGDVYLARDTRLGRKVALKFALGVHEDAVRTQMLHEARLTARLSHPHIVTIHFVGIHEGSPFLAFEYLEGETLRQRLNRGSFPNGTSGPALSAGEMVRIALAVCEALAAAHAAGVLHRDLKPDNVMLPRDGRLRVVDFGLANAFEAVDRSGFSEAGGLHPESSFADVGGPHWQLRTRNKGAGTPLYMAPELWLGEEATPAADVWAFGVVLYELLAGRRPYEALTPRALAARLRTSVRPPPPLADVGSAPTANDLMNQQLASIAMRCLHQDPKERPTAGALASALAQLSGATSSTTEPAIEREAFFGLRAFAAADAPLFFGRDDEIAACIAVVERAPTVVVVGPSGAGKTSFLQAGVLPRLTHEQRVFCLSLRPGRTPLRSLAREVLRAELGREAVQEEQDTLVDVLREPGRLGLRLRHLAKRLRLTVILQVDALEEVFTLHASVAQPREAEDRQAFLRHVLCAADDVDDPLRVVVSMRDDFLGRLSKSEHGHALLESVHLFALGPMSAQGLRAALLRPVAALGYAFEDHAIVDDMVAEVSGQAAALPVLQFCARALWDRRDRERRMLLRESYRAVGGVAGALATHADLVMDELPSEQALAARAVLVRLVTDAGTRRVASAVELCAGLPSAEVALARLVEARLVTLRGPEGAEGAEGDEPEVELVHDALVESWASLRGYLDEGRRAADALAEMGAAARAWQDGQRAASLLLPPQDARLARRRLRGHSRAVPALMEAFLNASEERARRQDLERRRRFVAASALLGSLFVVLVLLAGLFFRGERIARASERRALLDQAASLREGASEALARWDLLEARAKLSSSLEIEDAPFARGVWRRLRSSPLLWQREVDGGAFQLAFSSDGRTLAVGHHEHAVTLIDVASTDFRSVRGHDDQVLSVAYPPAATSPESSRLASGDWAGHIRVFNPVDNTTRVLDGHAGPVLSLAFSPDGTTLASAGKDGTTRLWGLLPGASHTVLYAQGTPVYAVEFSHDGTWLLTVSQDPLCQCRRDKSPSNNHTPGHDWQAS
jgi:serine/threonine protein kinase